MSDLIRLHLAWLRAGRRSPRTVASRERLLRHVERTIGALDRATVEQLAGYLDTPSWSTWTVHTYYSHLVGFFSWAVIAGYLPADPTRDLLRPPPGDRLPDPASPDELGHALTVLPDQPWRMAVLLAAYAGLRCCEIVILRREHCTEQLLRMRGKGGRLRTVPMHPLLWATISPLPVGLVVRSVRGHPLSAYRLTQSQGRVWDRIGQPHQHLHRFRHMFATQMLLTGADIREVQEAMGHRSLTSTQGYTQVAPVRLAAAVARIPPPRTAAS